MVGTKEGNKEEIYLVKELNKKINTKLWDDLNQDLDNTYAIHITTNKITKLSNKKVKPKADVFLAKGTVSKSILENKDYYLSESDFNKLSLRPLDETGISVKIKGSKKYTIAKLGVETFIRIFDDSEIGCGASLYTRKESDLLKNELVIKNWNTTPHTLINYFNKYFENLKINDLNSIDILNKIKSKSNELIIEMTRKNHKISNYIYTGIGYFNEPFCAHWFYQDGLIEKNKFFPFRVTTGSGRSRGDFTIVFKPQKL